MEPSNLNESDSEDAALKSMIRGQSPTIPDDGFSQRVLAALPPPGIARRATAKTISPWTWIAYFGGGTAGILFAASRVANWTELGADAVKLADSLAPAASAFTEPWLTIALTLCMLSLALAWPFYRQHSGR